MPRPRKHRATIVDLARHCGVSTSTVSLALRGDVRVVAATRARILAAAQKLGYRPNAAARSLVMNRYAGRALSRLIALSLPLSFYRGRYFQEIMQGALEVADQEGFGLLTLTHLAHTSSEHEQRATLPTITRHDVDGLIVFAPATPPAVVQWLRADAGFGPRPIVAIEAMAGCSGIITDDEQGAHAAACHLLALGHRALLLYIYAADEPRSQRRLAGAQRAFRESGIDPKGCHTLRLSGRWNNPNAFVRGVRLADVDPGDGLAREQLLRTLRRHPSISAIIGINDANALHVHHALAGVGLRVPEDLSVVGFDDTDPLLDAAGNNLLTTVRVPVRTLGAEAARLLLERVSGRAPQDRTKLVATVLVVRGSTGHANARTEGRLRGLPG